MPGLKGAVRGPATLTREVGAKTILENVKRAGSGENVKPLVGYAIEDIFYLKLSQCHRNHAENTNTLIGIILLN